MGSLICSDLDDVLSDAREPSGLEVSLGVICEGLLVELGFEVLECQGIVEDDAIINGLTFGDGVTQRNAGTGGEAASL